MNGNALEHVHDALLSAFPARDPLEQMLEYRMGVKLNTLVGEGETQDAVVHRVVTWADEHGKLGELVAQALSEVPGNPDLQQAALKLLTYVNSVNRRPRPATVTDTSNLGEQLQSLGQSLHEKIRGVEQKIQGVDQRVSNVEERLSGRMLTLETEVGSVVRPSTMHWVQWLMGWILVSAAANLTNWHDELGLSHAATVALSALIFLVGLFLMGLGLGYFR